MSTTNYLGLNIPDKNSKGRVVTDVFEPNFTKIDQNAEKLKTEIDGKLDKGSYVGTAENLHADDNAIWGGEYGGYIQDTSVAKVVGKRYIDQFDKKAYICRVAGSHINTTTHYEECNVKDNLGKLNGILNIKKTRIRIPYSSFNTTICSISSQHKLRECRFDTGIKNIISATPEEGYGYAEGVNVYGSDGIITPFQFITDANASDERGDMHVILLYIE